MLRRLPQTFEIVELARLLGENMDDEIRVIDQDPFALFVALGVGWAHPRGLQTQLDLVCDGLHLPRVGAAAKDEVVGKCSGALFHLEDGKFFRFFVEAGLNGCCYLVFQIVFFHAEVVQFLGRWSIVVGRLPFGAELSL